MKPNLIVVQPAHLPADPIVDRFCESRCGSHYVYLIRPIDSFREDSPAGVRFLNLTPDRLPGFGEVDTVVIVGETDIADRLHEAYPSARQHFWDPEVGMDISAILPAPAETVVEGNFGAPATRLARAI